MQEPKADRRIVSKGAYVRVQTRSAIRMASIVGILVGAVILANEICTPSEREGSIMGFVVALLMTGTLAWQIAGQLMDEARTIEPVVLLTRANTADLPAPDSLVRASQEPAQAQQGVLLRAASGAAHVGQEEQLLRASVGGQE